MTATTLEEDLQELESAEEFLDYFAVDYDASVVHVNRLHILQRFHDYLEHAAADGPPDRVACTALLERAYRDFVTSDARSEKVFKVFRQGHTAFVPLEQLRRN